MRVAFVTPQYVPDIGPSVPIFKDICEDIARSGMEPHVFCAFPHHGGQSRPEFKRKWAKMEIVDGVRVTRSFVLPKGRTVFQRLLFHISLNISTATEFLKAGRFEVIVASGPVLWSGMTLLLKGVLGQVPFVYVVADIYPDIAVQLGFVSNRFLIKMLDHAERFFYSNATAIVVLSEGMKNRIAEKGVVREKIHIVPPCVDTEFIKPLDRLNPLRKKWGLENKFVVMYAGTIGLAQGLETVVAAAGILQADSEMVLILVGDGVAKQSLQEETERLGLKNVLFLPLQGRELVPLVFGLADISLVSLSGTIVAEAVPSKLFTIMASGKPVVATVHQGTEVARIIEDAQCGLCVPPEEPAALASAILKLRSAPDARAAMGRRGRRAAEANYSREFASTQYEALIQSCVNQLKGVHQDRC